MVLGSGIAAPVFDQSHLHQPVRSRDFYLPGHSSALLVGINQGQKGNTLSTFPVADAADDPGRDYPIELKDLPAGRGDAAGAANARGRPQAAALKITD